MAPVFGYWKARGLGQSIRYVLEYTGEKYGEKTYEYGPAPDYDRSAWTSEKFNLGLQLPNLPYFIDGDTKLTQSYAILRHFGRKYDLFGKNEKEMYMIDMMMEQGKDMRTAFSHLCYFNYNDKNKSEYIQKLPAQMKMFSDNLGNQKWFVNDKISLADFVLYEEFYANLALEPSCLDAYPNLKEFMKRFEGLPALKKYMATPKFKELPINGPMAIFVGRN